MDDNRIADQAADIAKSDTAIKERSERFEPQPTKNREAWIADGKDFLKRWEENTRAVGHVREKGDVAISNINFTWLVC